MHHAFKRAKHKTLRPLHATKTRSIPKFPSHKDKTHKANQNRTLVAKKQKPLNGSPVPTVQPVDTSRQQFYAHLRKLQNWGPLFMDPKYVFTKPEFSRTAVLEALPQASPKIKMMLDIIEKLDANDLSAHGNLHKHFIFSEVDEGGYGARIVISALIASGYTNMIEDMTSVHPPVRDPKRKTFVYLSSKPVDALIRDKNRNIVRTNKDMSFDSYVKHGDTRVKFKQLVIDAFNHKDNNHGQHVRFIVLDKKYREGLDLFDVKYAHLLESMTPSQEKQAMGRGTRFCGQRNLKFKTGVGWKLHVYRYLLQLPREFAQGHNWPREYETLLKQFSDGDDRAEQLTNVFTSVAEVAAIDRALAAGLRRQFQKGGVTTRAQRESSACAANVSLMPKSEFCKLPADEQLRYFKKTMLLVHPDKNTAPHCTELATAKASDLNDLRNCGKSNPSAVQSTADKGASIWEQMRAAVAAASAAASTVASKAASRAKKLYDDRHDYLDTAKKFGKSTKQRAKELYEGEYGQKAKTYKDAVVNKAREYKTRAVTYANKLRNPVLAIENGSPRKTRSRKYLEAAQGYANHAADYIKDVTKNKYLDAAKVYANQALDYASTKKNEYLKPNAEIPLENGSPKHDSPRAASPERDSPLAIENGSPKRESPRSASPKRASPKLDSPLAIENGAPNRESPRPASPKRESPRPASPKRESPRPASPKRSPAIKQASPKRSPAIKQASPKTVQDTDDAYNFKGPEEDPEKPYVHPPDEIIPPITDEQLADLKVDLTDFQRQIAKKFGHAGYATKDIVDECNASKSTERKAAVLSKTQDFLRRYITPHMPTHGLLCWHSTGSGKTCTAVSFASNFEDEGYTIFYVTASTLASEVYKNVWGNVICHGANIRDHENLDDIDPSYADNWIGGPLSYARFTNLVNGLSRKQGLKSGHLKQEKGLFDQTLMKRIDGFDALNNQLRERERDGLYKTLLIIDEAQKLYSGELTGADLPDMDVLENMIQNSYALKEKDPSYPSVKVVLMTATPISTDPFELFKLLNLLRPERDALPVDDADFKKPAHGFQDTTGINNAHLMQKLEGYISYLDLSEQKTNFATKIIHDVRVPMTGKADPVLPYFDRKAAQTKKKKLEDEKRAACKGSRECERAIQDDYDIRTLTAQIEATTRKTKPYDRTNLTQLAALQESAKGLTHTQHDFYPSASKKGNFPGYRYQAGPKGLGYYSTSATVAPASQVAAAVIDPPSDIKAAVKDNGAQRQQPEEKNFVPSRFDVGVFTGWKFTTGLFGPGYYTLDFSNASFVPTYNDRGPIEGWTFEEKGSRGMGYYKK